MDIPHNAGFNKENKSLIAKTHHKYILNGHMKMTFKSGLVKEGLEANDIVKMLVINVHVAIRATKVPL